jgi:hypothetical protein
MSRLQVTDPARTTDGEWCRLWRDAVRAELADAAEIERAAANTTSVLSVCWLRNGRGYADCCVVNCHVSSEL